MHEYSIVQSLFGRVEESLRGHRVTAVRRLTVKIGELSGVDPGLLRTAYELCAPGTRCAGADLVVVAVPARWCCRACGQEVARGGRLACASCGGGVELAEGSEIVLDRIEAEVESEESHV